MQVVRGGSGTRGSSCAGRWGGGGPQPVDPHSWIPPRARARALSCPTGGLVPTHTHTRVPAPRVSRFTEGDGEDDDDEVHGEEEVPGVRSVRDLLDPLEICKIR